VGKTSKGGALLSLLGKYNSNKITQSFLEIYNSNTEISYSTNKQCSGSCMALQHFYKQCRNFPSCCCPFSQLYDPPSAPLWSTEQPRNLSHQAVVLYGPVRPAVRSVQPSERLLYGPAAPRNLRLYFAAFAQLLQPSIRPEDGCPVLHLLSCKTQPLTPALAPSFSSHAQ
jgi:hypothetical protein